MTRSTISIVPPTKLTLDPHDPLYSAKRYLDAHHMCDGVLSLRHRGGMFYQYLPTTSYRLYEDATLRASLYEFLEKAHAKPKGDLFKPTTRKINDVLDAVRALSHLPAIPAAPCWLDVSSLYDPLDIIPCTNGLLYAPTRTLIPATPHLFALSGVDFAYDAAAPPPHHFLKFLHDLLPEDAESQETLQEWMGYLLTPRTQFQKIFLVVGPKRSGKGTIGRIIRALVGTHRFASPTLARLAEPFGLAVLIDKSVALITDARVSGKSDVAVLTERLLSLSGEDPQTLARKFLPDWTGQLTARFMLMTNELPRIEDVSGALASRFLVMVLRESFYGREDPALFDRFVPELPGILRWALEGWDRLQARGRFVQPAASVDMIEALEDFGSPISAFLRDRVAVHLTYPLAPESLPSQPFPSTNGLSISKDDLYRAWSTWCQDEGRSKPISKATFARNLRAVLPFLTDSRRRIGGKQIHHWNGLSLKNEQSQTDEWVF